MREDGCPCGAPASLATCCGRWLAGEAAPAPEALMRSRYTAYTLGREDYLLATWHPRTRPAALNLDAPPVPKWLGLKVVSRQQSGPDNARVAFVARYKIGGRALRMEETSRFERLDGRWYYVDGDVDGDVAAG